MKKAKGKKKEEERKIFTAGIITSSDLVEQGEYEDESGKILDFMLNLFMKDL